MDSNLDAWLRRQAVHIVDELPDDPGHMLKVLAYAREFVESFLVSRKAEQRGQEGQPLPFRVLAA